MEPLSLRIYQSIEYSPPWSGERAVVLNFQPSERSNCREFSAEKAVRRILERMLDNTPVSLVVLQDPPLLDPDFYPWIYTVLHSLHHQLKGSKVWEDYTVLVKSDSYGLWTDIQNLSPYHSYLWWMVDVEVTDTGSPVWDLLEQLDFNSYPYDMVFARFKIGKQAGRSRPPVVLFDLVPPERVYLEPITVITASEGFDTFDFQATQIHYKMASDMAHCHGCRVSLPAIDYLGVQDV